MDQFDASEEGGVIFATDSFTFAGYEMRLSAVVRRDRPAAHGRQWLDIAQARLLAEIRRQACIADRLG